MPHTDLVTHPLDPKSPEARALHDISNHITDRSDEYAQQITYSDTGKLNGESIRDRIGRLADTSKYYSHDLGRYLSQLSDLARDKYSYMNGESRTLKTLINSFADINERLQTHLQAFNESTSPFKEDTYDADKIAEAAAALRDTLAEGIDKANQAKTIFPDGDSRDQKLAEIMFYETMGSAMVGLSERIRERLDVLANGETVEKISITSQTQDLVQRALVDPALKSLTAGIEEAQDLQHKLTNNDLSEAAVDAMNSRSLDLQLMLNKNKVRDDEKPQLKAEKAKIDGLLDSYHYAVSLTDKPTKTETIIDNLKWELKGISFQLNMPKTPDQIVTLLERFRDLQGQLAKAEAPFFQSGLNIVKDNTQARIQRQDRYVENLSEARDTVGNDLAKYWREVKGEFLDNVDTLLGKDVKKTMDSAFGSGLADKLDSWDKEASKTKLNAEQLQAKASDVLSTIDAYSERAQLVIKAGNDPAKQEALDALLYKISALKKSVADRLVGLFKIGVFDVQ